MRVTKLLAPVSQVKASGQLTRWTMHPLRPRDAIPPSFESHTIEEKKPHDGRHLFLDRTIGIHIKASQF